MTCSYACFQLLPARRRPSLARSPLDEVWSESEGCLDFVRRARFRDLISVLVSQQRFFLTCAEKRRRSPVSAMPSSEEADI